VHRVRRTVSAAVRVRGILESGLAGRPARARAGHRSSR
jgi:hypothetical protein